MSVLGVFGLLALVVATCWWGVLPRLRKLAWWGGFIAASGQLPGTRKPSPSLTPWNSWA